jgi:pimeloyl-ACP methyl ester carboxylesterase
MPIGSPPFTYRNLEMPFANLKDFKLFYESHGAGEPIILIPGFASGVWNWIRQTEELAKDFRVVTFDPRGVGNSLARNDSELKNLSMQTFVEDVRRLLDFLKIEKTHILGASFGGFVAQEFALQFPERLHKLILACTTAGGANHIGPSDEILRSFAPDASSPIGEKIKRFIRPAFTGDFNRKHADEVERVCQMRETNEVAEAVYFAQLQTAYDLDLEDKIVAIETKTLVLTGDKDLIVPMENSLNLASKIPNATLKIVENGSHMFFIEKADEFNHIVREFCQNRLRQN